MFSCSKKDLENFNKADKIWNKKIKERRAHDSRKKNTTSHGKKNGKQEEMMKTRII